MESPIINDMRTPPAAPEVVRHGMSPVAVISIIVVLLAVGSWFILSNRQTVTYDDQGNPITHVAPGSVVKAFPQRFLVEDGVRVEESYTIDYKDQSSILSTARYMSAMSLEDNINAFGAIFVNEAWVVSVEPDYEATDATNFYALKDKEQVNVVFVPSEAGVEVIISHLLQR